MQRIGLDTCAGEPYPSQSRFISRGFLAEFLPKRSQTTARVCARPNKWPEEWPPKAVMKVLGDGWPRVPWTSIEVLADSLGRPKVRLHGKALELFLNLGLSDIDVSITHDAGLAIAVAVAAGNPCREG